MNKIMKARLRLALFGLPFAVLIVAALFIPSRFGSGLLLGFALTPFILFGFMIVFGMYKKKQMKAGLKPPPLPTTTWDYAADLKDMQNNMIDATSWRGSVLVVNYWATWCAPCTAEMPNLARLIEKTKDAGVQFAFITTEDAATVEPFIRKRGLTMPFLLQSGETPACFKGRGIPATFVLDRSGNIVMRHFGAAAWDAEPVVSFIRGLAATPS